VQHTDGTVAVAAGAIAVTRAVTPALAIALEGAAAIVSEYGTPLDHGAAMARELQIPCVVGVPGVYDALVDGEWISVDGDAGTVTRQLGTYSSSSS
jgi:phosphoenolpyruvate-protein kinase (PTS system EI component)